MASDGARTERLRGLGIGLAVVVFLLHAAVAGQDHVIDDAYVTFRYARNLAAGHGIVFNVGERVEGYTNFSWLLLSALSSAVGLAPATCMRLVGVGFGVGLVLLVASASRRLARGRDGAGFAGLPAATLMAASTPLAFYAATGLETALFALLVTGAGCALVEGRRERFALWVGAAFLTRPEAALLGVIGVVISFMRGPRPAALRGAALLAVIVLPYLAWKLWYFGSVLPNTLAAKPPSWEAGIRYVAWLLPELAGVLLVALTASLRGGKLTAAGGFLGLWAMQTAAVILEGGDWMRFGRLLVPWFGWLAIAADGRILELFTDLSRRRFRALPLLAAAATYFPLTLLDLTEMAEYADADEVDVFRAEVTHRIRASGASSIATFDIGLVGYTEPPLSIVDLAGLTDKTIARSPGLHYQKRPDVLYLRAKNPDAFLITARNAHGPGGPEDWFDLDCYYGTEGYVLRLDWFRANYVHTTALQINADYFLHWFRRKP